MDGEAPTFTTSTSATSTITGGFFQTGLADCDLDTDAVNYDLSLGKFICGDDDTGAGGTNDWAVSSTYGSPALTTTSSINLWSKNSLYVSSTLLVDGLSTFTYVSSTGFSAPYVSSTNLTAGNLTVVTSLSLPANSITDAMVANDITASNYLLLTGGTLTGGLSFTSMSGSNFFATNVSSTFASSTYTSTTALTAHAFFQGGLGDCLQATGKLLYTQSSGLFNCGTDASSTPGGLPGNIQFNDYGSFGGTNGLRYTTSTGLLNVASIESTNLSFFFRDATQKVSVTIDGSALSATVSGTLIISGATIPSSASSTEIHNGGLIIGKNSTNFRSGFFSVDTRAGFNGGTSVSGTLKVFSSSTFTTATLTGGLFQSGLTDCSADNQSLSYTLSTGLFGCGDDDTGGSSTVSTTNAQASHFTDVTPANFADNNTTELWNDSTRPNITPQSANNPVMINVSYMARGSANTDQSIVVRVVRENDPGSTTPTCDLTSDVQVGASVNGGGTLISAFTTNFTDIQAANGTILDFPATTTAVYYTVCTSASSTVTVAPTSTALYVGLTEIQGAGSGPPREYTRIYTESTTWTKPVTSTGFIGVRVWCVGGGGGGGGAGTAGQIGGGGGGGGAAYRYVTSSLLGASLSVTVGAAGAGGAAGNNDGTAGGTSSFNSLLTCTGGGAGQDGASGASVAAGGVGSGGAVNGTGRDGREPGTYTDSYRGIGGAAGADQGDTQDLSGSYYHSLGADGILGQWAGAGGVRPGEWDANSRNGSSGASYGGGGSGGQKVGAGADASGGNGKSGIVVVTELYN